MTDRPTDANDPLVQSAQIGSPSAIEEIVRRYHRDVRTMVHRYLGPTAAADDVAQEVFIEVYRNVAKYRGSGTFRGWILAITRNRIQNYFRKELKYRQVQSLDLQSDLVHWRLAQLDEDPFETRQARHDLDSLQQCIKALAPRQRRMIEQFYFEGNSAESIARQEGKKAGTVRMTLLRIRAALGKCIENKRLRE